MAYEKKMEDLREEINRLNIEIMEILARRVGVSLKIGEVKQRHGKPVVDRIREEEIQDQVRELASRHDIDPTGVERVFNEIIRLCTKAEMEEKI